MTIVKQATEFFMFGYESSCRHNDCPDRGCPDYCRCDNHCSCDRECDCDYHCSCDRECSCDCRD